MVVIVDATMDHAELNPPNVVRYAMTAADTLSLWIERPYGVFTGTVTCYRVRWRNSRTGVEGNRVFHDTRNEQLDIRPLQRGQPYVISLESGSRIRFGRPHILKEIVLENWRDETFEERLSYGFQMLSELSNWAGQSAESMPDRLSDRQQLQGRRKVLKKVVNKGLYITMLAASAEGGICVTTPEHRLPIALVDKSRCSVDEEFIQWASRLPNDIAGLLALRSLLRQSDESKDSTERKFIDAVMNLLCVFGSEKTEYYHFRTVKHKKAVIVVVFGKFVQTSSKELQRNSVKFVREFAGKDKNLPFYDELLDIQMFYNALAKQLRPGLYVAHCRLLSNLKQLQIFTAESTPAFLPCVFVRRNRQITKKEWSWLGADSLEFSRVNSELADYERARFYEQFFHAVDTLLKQMGQSGDLADYRICNQFLLEYGEVSVILIYPGPEKVVGFDLASGSRDPNTVAIPSSLFEKTSLWHISSGLFDMYFRVRSFVEFLQKTRGDNLPTSFQKWLSATKAPLSRVSQLLSQFEERFCWLNAVVSHARKSAERTGVALSALRRCHEHAMILDISNFGINRIRQLSTIKVQIGFPCEFPRGTSLNLQIQPETTVEEIVKLVIDQINTKHDPEEDPLDPSHYHLHVVAGFRQRRLRPQLQLYDLNEPWINGRFIVKDTFLGRPAVE